MKNVKEFIKSSCNFATALISLIFSLSFWLLKPNDTVDTWLFIIVVTICFFLAWLLTMLFLNIKEQKMFNTFAILSCTDKICLCSSNPTLSHDSIVSFYLNENGFESLIAYGFIVNIQGDGLIQIEPHELPNTIVSDEQRAIFDILNNHRQNIIIKPTVTKKTLENIVKLGGL